MKTGVQLRHLFATILAFAFHQNPAGYGMHSSNTYEDSFSYIKKNSDKAAILKEASLLLWDEAARQHRHAIEAIDRILRDFLDQPDLPFGGIMVAFGGDFQQTLPIVPKGSKEQIVGAWLQRSFLWPKIKVFHLTENMCEDRNDPESARFAELLQNIGHGKDLPLEHTFSLPPHMVCGPEISDLIQEIYPGIAGGEN
jgi:PIF1-like helicase